MAQSSAQLLAAAKKLQQRAKEAEKAEAAKVGKFVLENFEKPDFSVQQIKDFVAKVRGTDQPAQQ